MAAKMKLCRYLSKLNLNFQIILILISFSNVSYVQSSTTVPPTSTDVTTDQATTTTDAPTTTTIPTTTIPPTTTIAPGEPRTVIGDTAIGQCLCDLTGNQCDINCCCDEDCTEADKTPFGCDPKIIPLDDTLCFGEEIFPFSNSPARTTTNNGLFCIYYDNYKERNFYLDPDFILDIPSFNNYVDRYANPSLQSPVNFEEPVFDLNSFYRKGDTVYIVYPNEARGTFVLPAASVSNQCNDQNTIGYLDEINTECTRTFDNSTCTTMPGLAASSYFQDFRVVKTSGLFGYVVNGTFIGISTTAAPTTTPAATTVTTVTPGSNTTVNGTTVVVTTTTIAASTTTTAALPTTAAPTVNPDLVQTLYNNTYTIPIDTTTLTHLCVQVDGSLANCALTDVPTLTSGLCENVVQEARYFVTTDGINGIAEIQVQFVFANIRTSNTPFTQRFSVSYNSLTDSNDTFSRSGNPGYLIGKPLLYGTLNITTSPENVEFKEILIAEEPSLGLTVVRSSAGGVCAATSARTPVRFGENMRTGCLIRLNLADIDQATCQTIQRTIVETLEGPNVPSLNLDETAWVENNRYVATFGNTGRLKVGDWVKVLASDRPLPSSADVVGTDTCRLRMGLHIQVLYANVGALANPQAKIIGVALLYDSEQSVTFRCEGAFCQAGTDTLTQAFEVSQTVSFIDVSQPATKFAGEAPIFIARVPNDFFYPFLYYTSGSTRIAQQFLPVISITLVAAFINVKHLVL